MAPTPPPGFVLDSEDDSFGPPPGFILDEPQNEPIVNDGPGIGESLSAAYLSGLANINDAVGGSLSFLERNLGTGTGLGDSLLENSRWARMPINAVTSQAEKYSPQYFANKTVEGATSAIPMLLAPSTLPAMLAGGAMSGGQQFGRAIEAGASLEDANASAGLSGAIGGLLTAPVFQAAQATGPMLSRMAATGGINAVTAIPSTIGQAYADALATNQEVRPYDLVEPIAENMVTGLVTGAAFPPVMAGMSRLRGYNKPADLEAIRSELEGRFINRPQGMPEQAPDFAPPQPDVPMLQDIKVDDGLTPPVAQETSPQVAEAQPAAPDTIGTLKGQIDQVKEGLRQIAPDAVDPEPAPLPDPNPVVETAPVIKAPDESSSSFPKAPDQVEKLPEVTVQKNQANPNEAESLAKSVEVDESAWARLGKKAEELKITELDPTQAWFEGQIFGKDIPGISKALSALRNTSMPKTISDKIPGARDLYYKGGRTEVEKQSMVASEMTELLRPYFKSDNPQIVDGIIGQTRELTKQFQRERGAAIASLKETLKQANDIMTGKVQLSGDVDGVKQLAMDMAEQANKQLQTIQSRQTPRLTEADMKAVGATDADIQAVLGHKDAMNYALERLREGLKLQARKIKGEDTRKQYEADVDSYIDGMIDTNYFPATRTPGAYTVQLKNKDGVTVFRQEAASRRAAMKLASETAGKMKDVVRQDGDIFANPKVDVDAFPDLPANLAEQVKEFNPNKYTEIAGQKPVKGLTKHLIEAQVIPGYDTNIKASTVDYALGLSKWYGRQHARAVLDDFVSNLPEGSALRGYAQRYADGQLVKNEHPVVKGMLKFQNFMKLSGVPASALVNTTQTITTTVPKLSGELIKVHGAARAAVETPKVLSKVTGQAFGYLADRIGGKFVGAKLRKSNPELYQFLDEASKIGVLDSEGMKELYNHKQKIQGNMTAADSLMFMFSAAEQANRTIALLAGREAGLAQGLKGDALFDYAKEFVIKTQFDQTIANRPPVIAHGPARVITQYRPFQLNYLRFLRDNANSKDWPVVGLSIAALVGLGGAFAVPFAPDMLRMSESMGLSPKKSFRKFIGDEKWADRIMYGLPMDAGFSLAGALSPGEFMVSDIGTQGLAKTFGPTADYALNQLPKAYKALKEEDNPVAAFEIAGPRFTRGPLKALRAANQSIAEQGGLKNYQDRVILPSVTTGESALFAMGATPARLQKENEIISNEFRLLDAAKSRPKNYTKLIADAISNKDKPRLSQLMKEIRDYNASLEHLPMTERIVRMIIPNQNEIASQLAAKANPQVGVLKGAPAKARPGLIDMYRQYGKLQKRQPMGVEE